MVASHYVQAREMPGRTLSRIIIVIYDMHVPSLLFVVSRMLIIICFSTSFWTALMILKLASCWLRNCLTFSL